MKLSVIAAAAVILFSAGCGTFVQPQSGRPLPVIENDKAKVAAEQFFEQFIDAVKNNDGSMIQKDLLVDSIAENIGKAAFAQYCDDMKKHLGNVTAAEYICTLNNPLYHSFIWKLTCERESRENKPPVKLEILFHIQIVFADEQYKVLNFIITR